MDSREEEYEESDEGDEDDDEDEEEEEEEEVEAAPRKFPWYSSLNLTLTFTLAPKKKTRTTEPADVGNEEEEVVDVEQEEIYDEDEEPDEAEEGDEGDEADVGDEAEVTAKSGAPAANLKNAGTVPKAPNAADVEDDDED